jgi:hypothetical protein
VETGAGRGWAASAGPYWQESSTEAAAYAFNARCRVVVENGQSLAVVCVVETTHASTRCVCVEPHRTHKQGGKVAAAADTGWQLHRRRRRERPYSATQLLTQCESGVSPARLMRRRAAAYGAEKVSTGHG